MRAIGIDIGTTTISVILVDGDSTELLESRTIPHQAFLEGRLLTSRIQDPQKLVKLTEQAVRELIQKYGAVDSIGLTGQMHGVLYVDGQGEAVTPLYTWQDGSGNEKLLDGRTYAQALKAAAGTAASGFGMTTHFYLQENGLLPENAVKMSTISDYVGMKLCGSTKPVIAGDMAASWGCFDLRKGDFCRRELTEFGIDLKYLPELLPDHAIMGQTGGTLPKGIPVMVSLGDNQASMIGSVQTLHDTVLLNIGTGSQVSMATAAYTDTEGSIELRPCTKDQYLLAGSGLCGGRAYAMLEQFYREAGGLKREIYENMERQARAFLKQYGKDAAWKIRTTFSGTRSNPKERGSIRAIGVENFCPGAMTLGMLQGILEELHEMYLQMCGMTGRRGTRLVGSGNGIRKNRLMQELAEELFGMKMEIPLYKEEAAYGAALHSLVSAGLAESLEEVQKKIRYLQK